MIRPVTPEDAAAVCGIYNYYIENTTVTFEVGYKFGRHLDVGYWELLRDFLWN